MGSAVGIVTHYLLVGPGIVYPVGAELSTPMQTGREAHPAHVQCVPGVFPRGKVVRAWR